MMKSEPSNKAIDLFLNQLSCELVDDIFVSNMYFGDKPENVMRRINLKKYLKFFVSTVPSFILVGEAPGYNGCRISGIPFTSTKVIMRSPFFQRLDICDLELLQDESTASIVWNYFDDKGIYPLFWNAFPFHPHKNGLENTNRKPTRAELEVGKKYLLSLMEIFPEATIIAVGKTAQKSLIAMGIDAQALRHPAYGGKTDFINAMEKLLAKQLNDQPLP